MKRIYFNNSGLLKLGWHPKINLCEKNNFFFYLFFFLPHSFGEKSKEEKRLRKFLLFFRNIFLYYRSNIEIWWKKNIVKSGNFPKIFLNFFLPHSIDCCEQKLETPVKKIFQFIFFFFTPIGELRISSFHSRIINKTSKNFFGKFKTLCKSSLTRLLSTSNFSKKN